MEHIPNRVKQERAAVFIPPLSQLINPFKQLSKYSSPLQAKQPRCVGIFWDNVKKCTVRFDLGPVYINFPFVYRAAPSQCTPVDLSRVEGAAQYIEGQNGEQRTERSEGVAQPFGLSESCHLVPGPYVIPGQNAMGGNKC